MRKHFPVREKSGNLEQAGKVRTKILENGKNWKTQGNLSDNVETLNYAIWDGQLNLVAPVFSGG